MSKLPLSEETIEELCNGSKHVTYEIPIYQRNYAWEKDEISALVHDVYDAFCKNGQAKYYIGTLVSYKRDDDIYEVIDGQQRLTTINILMHVFGQNVKNKLTYRARKKSNKTLQGMDNFDRLEEKDQGIVKGHGFAKAAIEELNFNNSTRITEENFIRFFKEKVCIIHYKVPRDIDLNHYFEIMNSRGEQLEKHEIVKARLISEFTEEEEKISIRKFNYIWESCSMMNVYVQQKCKNKAVFGTDYSSFIIYDFDDIEMDEEEREDGEISIEKLLEEDSPEGVRDQDDIADTFQPIIDFPNFLLIVLKITRTMEEKKFVPTEFNLDDKELINEFDKLDNSLVKTFAFNLIKAKYFLDNYIVHHSNEDDVEGNNPWLLEKWKKEGKNGYNKNLVEGNKNIQDKLVQLLSMFEVSFTARQRKNYLFYCLLFLFKQDRFDANEYCAFVEKLAQKYMYDVYLDSGALNDRNIPKPGSFDEAILMNGELQVECSKKTSTFSEVYGEGTSVSNGIPLFVFNYMDYKIWKKYAEELRGEKVKEGSAERKIFFAHLGCSDFGLDAFRAFYFSRTRRSLEHYYPQANVGLSHDRLDVAKINCFGNFAMIGSEANSAGSNWSPIVKVGRYLDTSRKIAPISVASLKFMVMMQMCKDNENIRDSGEEWKFEDIKKHQEKMVALLME
ncbi:MAG TPA: DUF262 domain-containing protein [Candidatus Merdenecus merdavium]|nr:DUF262 domain-containing protein [Candidatus Merdenecus merdavium]